ncbi:SMI1/KNR4 family protein [Kitasatospora sp. NPDC058965]|uniref:SMI1/KNR4 family protein n=1 Tax=Kitasatospora sp. NPDC058965 TaxID=3346682 RepID=UPI00369C1BBD
MTDPALAPNAPVHRQWRSLLEQASRLSLSPDTHEVERRFPADAHANQWLGSNGAGEAEIGDLEDRLGRRLPPSYRSFLAVSNGWLHLNDTEGPLLGTDGVGWLRDLDPAFTELWSTTSHGVPDIPDEEYLVYGEEQDCVDVRREHFPHALQISDWGDSALLMLNPMIVNAEGEWEAWAFASWYPGVYRYPSFWDLAVDLITSDHPDADWGFLTPIAAA